MEQQPMFIEDGPSAIRALADKIGQAHRQKGMQALGHMLRPGKSPDEAGRWLADCLNPTRNDKLDPFEDIPMLIKLGNQYGVPLLLYWFCDEGAYNRPAPIKPEDQQEERRQQFVRAVHDLTNLARALGVQVPS